MSGRADRVSRRAKAWLAELSSHRDDLRAMFFKGARCSHIRTAQLRREVRYRLNQLQRGFRDLYAREAREVVKSGTRAQLAGVALKLEFAYVGCFAIHEQLAAKQQRARGGRRAAVARERKAHRDRVRSADLVRDYGVGTGANLTMKTSAHVRESIGAYLGVSPRQMRRVVPKK
jgi:hypothetical protein